MLKRASIPSTKELSGLISEDEKRLGGLALLSWQACKCLTWIATVVDTIASSYLLVSTTRVGGAANAVAERKSRNTQITNTHSFVPY